MKELIFKSITDFHAFNKMREPENPLFSVSHINSTKEKGEHEQNCDSPMEPISLFCDFYNISLASQSTDGLACQSEKPAVDLSLETQQILKLHNLQRQYHFEKDSVSFADQLSKNFISVNRGYITNPSRDETISRYHNYLSSVEFETWDDVSEPIIRFSEDGKMAYTIVDKIVRLRYELEDGEEVQDETHYAWTTIYRKYGDEWKIDCVSSTERE